MSIGWFCFVMGLGLKLSASPSISSLQSGPVASLPVPEPGTAFGTSQVVNTYFFKKKSLFKRKQIRQVWPMERAHDFVREHGLPLNLATHRV